MDDGQHVGAARHILHERAVDLDGVEWIVAEEAQRRGAGAEVIHGELDAQALQFEHEGVSRFGIAHDLALRDLELQALLRQPDMLERSAHLIEQAAAQGQLGARHVHADCRGRARQVLRAPVHHGAAGLLLNPLAQSDDQARLFGDRNEFGRRYFAQSGVLPTQ